ncbi:Lyzozyme M1 (1,4-beta-N-acetylmuramidase), GH25 family [Amycolatopsis sacchari]|uniref:Lyzozyme M1 (1,4-beta-N-acetylmuramidase), GH25 family n=1 Tax=Amycolatopsis sacchari TaxID=115433 RepID=A0A1I3X494_9PSEU|nr:GH25 family lysozyme [Amycolatopsis sacchari]SFK13656.1 Lyzozyme M1 (1,4-beta-N-acetylmuramidase), GH25 family [Amycolatopsis sacchari]
MTEDETARGINLSLHATVADWDTVRSAAVVFASITVTENVNWADTGAQRQIAAAQEAGVRAGIRHYARPGAPHDQAEHCVRLGKQLGVFGPGSLAPALDVDAAGVDDRFVKAWIKGVRQAAGIRRVLVYAPYDSWLHHLNPDKWADSDVVLWVRRHNGIPGRPGWFHPRLGVHQHRAAPIAPGLSGPIGLDALVYPFTLADILL